MSPLSKKVLDAQVNFMKSNPGRIQGGEFSFIVYPKVSTTEGKTVAMPVFINLSFDKAIRVLSHYKTNLEFKVKQLEETIPFEIKGNYPDGKGACSITVNFNTNYFDVSKPDGLYELRKAIWVKHMEFTISNILVNVFMDPWGIAGKTCSEHNYVFYLALKATRKLSSADFLGWGVGGTDADTKQGRTSQDQKLTEKFKLAQKLWDKKLVFNFQKFPVKKETRIPLPPSNQKNGRTGEATIVGEGSQMARNLKNAVTLFFEKALEEINTKRTNRKLTKEYYLLTRYESGKKKKEFLTMADLFISAASHAPYILVAQVGGGGRFLRRYEHPFTKENKDGDDTKYVYALICIENMTWSSRKITKAGEDRYHAVWWFLLHELLHTVTPIYNNEYDAYEDWPSRKGPDDVISELYEDTVTIWETAGRQEGIDLNESGSVEFESIPSVEDIDTKALPEGGVSKKTNERVFSYVLSGDVGEDDIVTKVETFDSYSSCSGKTVELKFSITTDGIVRNVAVAKTSGDKMLDIKIGAALQKWRFKESTDLFRDASIKITISE